MPPGALVLVGEQDEAVDGAALLDVLNRAGYQGRAEVLSQTTHFGIFHDAKALKMVTDLIAAVAMP